MKKLIFFIIPALLLLISGCSSSNSGNNPIGGIGGIGDGTGGGGTGSITWTIGQRQGNQGGTIFTASPSTAATITSVTLSLPAQNFDDPLQGDGQTVYQQGQVIDLTEITGVEAGQQWTINFKGNLGSATGAAYDVTSNYTVQ